MLQTAQKKFCNYCKKDGHILKECPPKRNVTAFTASIDSSIPNNSANPTSVQQNAYTTTSMVTPEMVQQMIVSAFSALGFSGKYSSSWYDSGASNHMTSNAQFLTNIKKYFGNLKIHTADGNQLPITATGDISSSLTNVFISRGLTSNLISVGQLVENDCQVQFSQSGCLVQDQQSGKIIAKGPKVGPLFPIQFSLPPSLSLPLVSCNSAIVDYQVWHKRLDIQTQMYFMTC